MQQRLDVELSQNLFELFITIVNDFWGDQCDIRFIKQEPVSVFAFKYLEVFIEERSISLKFFLTYDLAFAVVGGIH